MPEIQIMPSILAADFGRLAEGCKQAQVPRRVMNVPLVYEICDMYPKGLRGCAFDLFFVATLHLIFTTSGSSPN